MTVAGGREDERIGYVALYTVGRVEVPFTEIKKWWESQNVLPMERMPRAPSAFDAFKNTCSQDNIDLWEKVDAEQKADFEALYKGEQVQIEYIVVPNPQNKFEYIFERRVWMKPTETEDAKMVIPEYPNIARLRFDSEKDEIVTIPFENYEGSGLIEDIDRVANAEYKNQKLVVNASRHRNLIREFIESEGGIHLMGSGGTYFIPAAGYPKLEKLKQYFDEVVSRKEYAKSGHRSDIMTLDAYDDEKMRKRIQEDIETEVTKQYEDLLDDTLKYLDSTAGLEKDTELARVEKSLAARLAKAERLGALKGQYESMLGTKITMQRSEKKNLTNMSGRAQAMMAQIAAAVGVQ
jgi:hypothetical protein